MNESDLLEKIQTDLRRSPVQTVIYLEGRTDPKFLFAALGVSLPVDELHQDVLVKGLNGKGSGSKAVKARVELASRMNLPRVFGVTDGDGRAVEDLASAFDAPHPGPLFSWKSYCIENLIAKTGWPTAWGNEPDWTEELVKYGPYAALNRLVVEAQSILNNLRLVKHLSPDSHLILKTSAEIGSELAIGKASLLSFDVEHRFSEESSLIEATIRRSLDEAHAIINGKWLLGHIAENLTKRDRARCEYEWLAYARSVGGLPEVRERWERVTGNPP